MYKTTEKTQYQSSSFHGQDCIQVTLIVMYLSLIYVQKWKVYCGTNQKIDWYVQSNIPSLLWRAYTYSFMARQI